ncbi:MAG: peptidylprolyl isomerase [Clostridiales bacterium]|nr:peptidylprolyl isomerase [Clostridiales bacterium]
MTKIRKTLALLLCLCMLWGTAALAEDAAATTGSATTAVTELNGTDVLATINGENVSWDDVKSLYSSLVSQYGSGYDLTQQANVDLFRAVALENRLTEVLMEQKAKEFGLDQLTDEEIADSEAQADADWEAALANYEAYFYPDLTEESSEEEKAAAREEALNYYKEQGYTLESLREDYKRYSVLNKVTNMMVQDATVTDQEVEDLYQSLVAADKELYENDIAAYEAYNSYVDQMAMYAALYGTSNNLDYAWYKPDGFRAVKHILLPVDSELMTTYTDLQARWEEQQEAAQAAEESTDETADTTDTATTEATAEPTATPEPVTEEQVNEAKAAIFNSLADTIDEINQKIADGVDFDELIATYGVNEDGTASDPGMTTEPYMTSGYEVCSASTSYVPEFVEAAMSIDSVGGVSAPYLSSYGVHIVKYIGDVEGGPIPMTDEQREAKRQSLLTSKQNELYAAKLEAWMAEADITYTGVTPSIAELEGAQSTATDAASTEAETQTTEETAAPEATEAPAA